MDAHHFLIHSISRLMTLPKYEIDKLLEISEYKNYKRGHILTRQGEIENFVYFIVEGAVRNYVIQKSKELTLDFFFSGAFTNAYMSFLTRQKSEVNVKTIVPTKVLRMHVNNIEKLYADSIHFNRLGRLIAETQYIRRTRRELSFITRTARERYDALFTESPDLIRQIPLKHIATYLGIKAETLSRIRKTEAGRRKNAS